MTGVQTCALPILRAIDPTASLDDAALAPLQRHPWRGNFRELRAVLTRALLQRCATAKGVVLGRADIEAVLAPSPAASSAAPSVLQRSAGALVRTEFERCGRSVSRTARTLGVSRTTVYRHLRD